MRLPPAACRLTHTRSARIGIKPGLGSILTALMLLALLPGCQHTYQETRVESSKPRQQLDANAIAYVSIPPDAKLRKGFAENSGKVTANAVREAFARYFKRVYVGRRIETFEEGLASARSYQWSYFIYPVILRWEDRATETSGRRDLLELQMRVVDTATGEVLDTTVLKGRSRWMNDGGDTPADLIAEPVKDYAASFFNPMATPSSLR
ncbi:MAG: DUF4823 domain-containing protein [Verrucomicrobia bacterium]|jgi:hypothetical protein|nr:DUF4823 domain-containing protein [Verrucomicrobiota bacterium]